MMINEDKRMIMVKDVVVKLWGLKREGTCQPYRANSGTCISWTSTKEEEDSFVWYTLRMRHQPTILSR
ncbi:hypothetical protein AAG906_011369 [Vitis piasezkii]